MIDQFNLGALEEKLNIKLNKCTIQQGLFKYRTRKKWQRVFWNFSIPFYRFLDYNVKILLSNWYFNKTFNYIKS